MNIFSSWWKKDAFRIERQNDGSFNFWNINGTTSFSNIPTYADKLNAVLSNPALLKVFCIQCDLFSLGEINVVKGKKIQDKDPLYNLLNRPNPFQTRRQFLWDFMFWEMLGTATALSTTKNIINDNTRLYWLNQGNIEIPKQLKDSLDKRFASKAKVNELSKEVIKYKEKSGNVEKYKLDELMFFFDLTNGIDNWYSSPSRLDALYKVITNSDIALNAKNINLRFSSKFMVAGKQNPENIHELPLSESEKKSVENAMLKDNPVEAVKSMIDIKRYVEDMRKLELDAAFEYDYFIIGSMYNIPKEILGIYLKDSNGLNESSKEKAIGRHVGYSLQPKADDLANGLETYFGYDKQNRDITITFDHLPFMQALEAERSTVNKEKATTLKELLASGVTPESAIKLLNLDIEFKPIEDETEPIGEVDATA